MKTYTLEPTRDKKLFRVVNIDHDWALYYYAPKKAYLNAVSDIIDKGYAKGVGLINFFKKNTAEEAENLLQVAGEKGSRLHRAIEGVLSLWGALDTTLKGIGTLKRETMIYNRNTKVDEKLSTTEWNALLSFGSFWTKHEPQIVAIEESIYNLKYGYAGTLDAILILTKACDVKTCNCRNIIGKVGIWDWKSGKGLYASYGAQIAAYGNAPSLKRVLGAAKPEYTALLRIGTSHKTTGGYEMVVYNKEETHTNWDLFLAALKIAKTEIKPFDPEKEVYEIPDTLDLKVEYKNLIEPKPKNATKTKHSTSKSVEDGKGRKTSKGSVRGVLETPAPDATVS